MKNNILFGLLAFMLVAFLGLSAFGPSENKAMTLTTEMPDGILEETKNAFAGSGASTYRYSYSVKTITNAAKDTSALPVNLLTNYQLQIIGVRSSVSGTHNVKMYLDESNLLSGITDWRVIDSTSTTSATIGAIRQSVTYGTRYRIRLSGTGTQSSRCTLSVVAKPLI